MRVDVWLEESIRGIAERKCISHIPYVPPQRMENLREYMRKQVERVASKVKGCHRAEAWCTEFRPLAVSVHVKCYDRGGVVVHAEDISVSFDKTLLGRIALLENLIVCATLELATVRAFLDRAMSRVAHLNEALDKLTKELS